MDFDSVRTFAAIILIAFAAMSMYMAKNAVLRQLWYLGDRSDKAANKLAHIEERAMRNYLRMHEFVRMFSEDLHNFMPEADSNWLVRRLGDWTVL